MKDKRQHIAFLAAAVLLLGTMAAQAKVRYVSPTGSGKDGQSWSTAYRNIQTALSDSALGNGDEIWVKQGLYSVYNEINVNKAVKILGGFSGSGSTRDSDAYVTTLDGKDDSGCFHVTANAQIDGLTFAHGHAWGGIQRGGGIYIFNCKPTISNCTFYRNHASYSGGGISAEKASGTVIADCLFVQNTANWYGGGIATKDSNVTISGCTFEANDSNLDVEGWGGGGIFVERGTPTITGCLFTDNSAYYGAGICNYYANSQIDQCVFADCNSVTSGGGGLINYGGSPHISNCFFSGNRVASIGGGILDKSTATVVNCVLWKNSTPRYGGGIYVDSAEEDIESAPRFINCTVYSNSASRGGGLYSNNTSPTLVNCIVWNNSAYISGPGIYNDTLLFYAKTEATYSNIQGNDTYEGTGNLRVEPGFTSPSQGDFHLLFGSACIDVGKNSASGMSSYDHDGKPRIVDGNEDGVAKVDLGAFEFRGRMVSDYLHRAQMAQGIVYDSPDDPAADYTFLLELQTGANVSYINFSTPGGYTYTIPSSPHTSSAYVDTYHQVSGSTHVWTYMAQFGSSAPLTNYGDGTYTVTLHYVDGTDYDSDLWYGIPGSSRTLPQPSGKPNITSPTYGGGAGSPVIFKWNRYSSINSIYVAIIDPSNGQDLVTNSLNGNATESDPLPLAVGSYDAELSFENAYEVTNADGVPFSYGKAVVMGYEFEVLYTAVHRFWSSVTSRYFYTLSEQEKDWLIATYPDFWTYQGLAFHACADKYNADLAPVYRFWSARLGAHFYTISKAERDWLISKCSYTWAYEGTAYYAYPEDKHPAECVPVYRFWNPVEGNHFFTISESEKESLKKKSNKWTYEGIAFYVYE